jgi:poly-gamma-glutamate synthesis protein (capsule biosynthesis protein)
MPSELILTGDINLLNIPDPESPMRGVQKDLNAADLVFSNLECMLASPPSGWSEANEGFFVDPEMGGKALVFAGIDVVGLANNVNYGVESITTSMNNLKKAGIAFTGAGANLAEARAPACVERGGVRFGFFQRSAIYWGAGHAAGAGSPGIAVVKAHTAYQLPVHPMPEVGNTVSLTRPGVAPVVLTWADTECLSDLVEEVKMIRSQTDVLVVAFHWGYGENVFQYMSEIAHAVIDAGADVVVGGGAQNLLPIEIYKGKPIFYALGAFSFKTRHGGRRYTGWVGMMLKLTFNDLAKLERAIVRFVTPNERDETEFTTPAHQAVATEKLVRSSSVLGTRLSVGEHEIGVLLPGNG